MTEDLTTPEGIAALAACGVALLALLISLVLAAKLRRLRRDQTMVMGDGASADLVDHAARLHEGFAELRDWVNESLERVEQRMSDQEKGLEHCLSHRALVRYDAYGELSGRQSSSVALLDDDRSGIVFSSILHRDQARVYVKELHGGQSTLDLSPEENAAIEAAMGAEPTPPSGA